MTNRTADLLMQASYGCSGATSIGGGQANNNGQGSGDFNNVNINVDHVGAGAGGLSG